MEIPPISSISIVTGRENQNTGREKGRVNTGRWMSAQGFGSGGEPRSSAVQRRDERWENSAPVLARVISRMKDEMMETKELGGATKRGKETVLGAKAD